MKAMVLTAPRTLSAEQVALAEPDGSRVRVRVTHTGICGTDLKVFNGAFRSPFPIIMGHEIVGEVVQQSSTGGPAIGRPVLIDPVLFCGHCYYCRDGQTYLCPNGIVMGLDTDGGLAEYIDVPPTHVFELPDEIDPSVAPLIQVMTTCVHSQRLIAAFPAESAVVIGLGVAGQLQLQLAMLRGCCPVIGLSRSAWKRAIAEGLGADVTIESGTSAKEQILAATHGRGADLVIDTTGTVASIAKAISYARPGGRILLFGITTAQEGQLPFIDLYAKELALISSRAAKAEDFTSSINLVKQRRVLLDPLITHRIPLHEVGSAMDLLAADVDQRLKIIVNHE